MATFTVKNNLCDLVYKTKNTILDSHFNSLNSEEKSQFISTVNTLNGKNWDVITVNVNNEISKVSYNQFFLERDTLPIQESISILGKGKPLIGVNEQPTLKINCTIQNISTNPNIGNVVSGIQSVGQNPITGPTVIQ